MSVMGSSRGSQHSRGCPSPGQEGLQPLSQTMATIPWTASAVPQWEIKPWRGSLGTAWPWWQGDAVAGWRSRFGVIWPTARTLQTLTCHLCPGSSCQPRAGWGPLVIIGEVHQDVERLQPSSHCPIITASHAGVTPGVPDSQPRQQLPPGWGKVHSIPHSQGDRGKL